MACSWSARTSSRYSLASSERRASSRSSPISAARSAGGAGGPTGAPPSEVAAREPLLHLELPAVGLREVQELVGLDRVRVLEGVEVVIEADLGRDAADVVEHRA